MKLERQLKYIFISKQQGAALITALVFMGIFTLLGISAMRSYVLDVKIHNSMKNRINAFQCAEAGLRQGEIYLGKAFVKPQDDTVGIPDKALNQVWINDDAAGDLNNLVNKNVTWWQDNGWADAVLTDPSVQVGCANSAQYIVQSLGGQGGSGSDDLSFKAEAESQVSGYRITSRSEGTSSDAAVIVQSTFIRQFH